MDETIYKIAIDDNIVIFLNMLVSLFADFLLIIIVSIVIVVLSVSLPLCPQYIL